MKPTVTVKELITRLLCFPMDAQVTFGFKCKSGPEVDDIVKYTVFLRVYKDV